jgi:HD-like signal output (HDOD) protein
MDSEKKRRILFVDDEELVLKGLQRMLRGMRKEWDMKFVTSARKALELIDLDPFDAVITDMRMPGMDGVELLGEIMKTHPNTVRIILSGQLDQEMILKSVRSAHQHLSKPCEPDLLKSTLAYAFGLRDLLADSTIKNLVSRIESLPSLPSLYVEIMEEVQSENTSFERVGEIISRDVGMTAKILQMVNSAFFGLRRKISNPKDAVGYLGFETIKSLVLTAKIFSQFDQKKLSRFSLDELWHHSMLTGTFAKLVAQMENQTKEIVDDAYMVGLLHDLGKLVLAQNLTEEYQDALTEAVNTNRCIWEIEYERFGTSHAEMAAYLMGLWGLNFSIVEAIAFHHYPGKRGSQMGILTLVHSANGLAYGAEDKETQDISIVDANYLADMDMMERFPVWQSACQGFIRKGANLDG